MGKNGSHITKVDLQENGMGIKNFFACGSAGQIDQSIDSTAFVLVDRAIRCEGASYHYLEPSLYIETDKDLTNFIADTFAEEILDRKIRNMEVVCPECKHAYRGIFNFDGFFTF